jgi:hypothetical protein
LLDAGCKVYAKVINKRVISISEHTLTTGLHKRLTAYKVISLKQIVKRRR